MTPEAGERRLLSVPPSHESRPQHRQATPARRRLRRRYLGFRGRSDRELSLLLRSRSDLDCCHAPILTVLDPHSDDPRPDAPSRPDCVRRLVRSICWRMATCRRPCERGERSLWRPREVERHHAEIEVRAPVEVPTVMVDDVLEGRQRAVLRIYGPATSTLSKVGDLKRPSSSALSMKPAISWRRWEEARGY